MGSLLNLFMIYQLAHGTLVKNPESMWKYYAVVQVMIFLGEWVRAVSSEKVEKQFRELVFSLYLWSMGKDNLLNQKLKALRDAQS